MPDLNVTFTLTCSVAYRQYVLVHSRTLWSVAAFLLDASEDFLVNAEQVTLTPM